MTKLQEFKEKVLSNEPQFEMQDGKSKKLYFVKLPVGKATYIFGDYSYRDEIPLDMKLSLQAILSDGDIYLDTHMFYTEENYPANVYDFSDKIKEVNSIISGELFTKYYDGLSIRVLTEDEQKSVEKQVRMTVLQNDSLVTEPKVEKVMTKEDIAKLLCGFLTIEGVSSEYFEKYRENYIAIKSKNNELKKLVELKFNLEKWEIDMANSLRNLDAKTVTVDFNYKGVQGTEKVEKDSLLRTLYNEDYFSSYNFANGKKGEKLLEKLNVGTYKHHEKGTLECEHIESIKYGRNTIYSKK